MLLFDKYQLKKIHASLVKRKETIAVAESVTSGLLQAAFSQSEEASAFYHGGITVYNLGQKYKHLKVEPIYAENCFCVSQKVSNEMAINVCDLFSSHWGIGITGFCTPVPESENKLFAYLSIAYQKKIIFKQKIVPEVTDPFAVQLFYTQTTLDKLLKKLV